MLFAESFVAIIDVGHGNSTVIYDRSSTVIVDCGTGSSLLEFLEDQGIEKIDIVFLSHSDKDHIAGLVGLISSAKYVIGKVYVNSDSTKKSKLWDDLLYELSHSEMNGGIQLCTGLTNSSGSFFCGEVTLNVIGPSPYLAAKSAGGIDRLGRRITSNSISASFLVSWKHQTIAYLAGDIDQIALDDLIAHGSQFEAPVLVFPHHGGRSGDAEVTSFTKQICEATKASIIIFSIGRNEFSNPRPEIVSTIRKMGKDVRIACTQLSKHCSNTVPSHQPEHLLPVFSHGKSSNQCCSGTFIITLSDSVSYFPQFTLHDAYIKASASTPLCR